MEPASRVRVPYSPFFLQQVKAGNVAEITSKGTDIQGTFKKATSYKDAKATTRFQTEIPAFANTDELSQVLQDERRHGQRRSRSTPARRGGRRCCSASGRRSCSSSCSSG